MRYENKQCIIDAATNTSVFSSAFDTNQVVQCSARLIATSGVTGNFKLQCSDDPIRPTEWNDVPNSAIAVTAAGNYLIPRFETTYNFIRIAFIDTTDGANTGTITCNFFSHGM